MRKFFKKLAGFFNESLTAYNAGMQYCYRHHIPVMASGMLAVLQ